MNAHLASLGISNESIKARGLCEHEEASTLVIAETGIKGRDYFLIPLAAEAWRAMKSAALADNVEIFIVSAFRSVDRQAEIIQQKIDAGESIESVITICAPPGFSEHHTGRAIDISTPGCRSLEIEFDQTSAYHWLNKHAAKFGYYLTYPINNPWGYQYEPWHWCFKMPNPSFKRDS